VGWERVLTRVHPGKSDGGPNRREPKICKKTKDPAYIPARAGSVF